MIVMGVGRVMERKKDQIFSRSSVRRVGKRGKDRGRRVWVRGCIIDAERREWDEMLGEVEVEWSFSTQRCEEDWK
jgi:hypothetical protein